MFNSFNDEPKPMLELDLSRCSAKQISSLTAAPFVEKYHYKHVSPNITIAIGMYCDNVLIGVITYGSPAQRNMFNVCGPEYLDNGMELNRLVIKDLAGHNSESWLIGQSWKIIQNQLPDRFILVSYADTQFGHIGLIYQATNWLYTGTTSETKNPYDKDGNYIHRRTLMERYGTSSRGRLINKGIYWKFAKLKHRYVYFLGDKRQRKMLISKMIWPILPYPKEILNNN